MRDIAHRNSYVLQKRRRRRNNFMRGAVTPAGKLTSMLGVTSSVCRRMLRFEIDNFHVVIILRQHELLRPAKWNTH